MTFYTTPWENTVALALTKQDEQWYKVEAYNADWRDGFRLEAVSLTEEEIEGYALYKEVRELSPDEAQEAFGDMLPMMLDAQA